MKKIIICSLLLFFCPLLGAEMTSGEGHSVLSFFESFQLAMSSGWVTMDGGIAATDVGAKTVSESTVTTGVAYFLEGPSIIPDILSWNSARYFTSAPSAGSVLFRVLYTDPYLTLPPAGYPKVAYSEYGSTVKSTATLTFAGLIDGTTRVYELSVALPKGLYEYKYIGMTDYLLSEYTLEASSMAVTENPTVPVSSTPDNAAAVPAGRVVLSWSAQDPEGSALTYRLRVGKTPETMLVVYTGPALSFALQSLDPSSDYCWQVEAIDNFGAGTLSPVFQFSTVDGVTKALNFPNPFNPTREQTHIVFPMPEAGSARVRVYTELGDLVWDKTFTGLTAGANEILYDGKDDNGNFIFNGTYVCMINKNYSSGEQVQKCRLLVIK